MSTTLRDIVWDTLSDKLSGTRMTRRVVRFSVVMAAVLHAVPVALSRHFPGLDLPFHAMVLRAIHDSSAASFLGHVVRQPGGPSYWLVYGLGDVLMYFADQPALALQVIIAGYVVAFGLASSSLYRAYGASPLLALGALPAAYALVLLYGFVAFAVGLPAVLWQWAAVRRALASEGMRELVAVFVWSLVVAIAHPFAAGLGALGVGVVVLAFAGAYMRRAAAVAVCGVIGTLPAIIAVLGYASNVDGTQPSPPGLMANASLFERLFSQPLEPLSVALVAAPARILALLPPDAALWALLALIIGVSWLRGRRGPALRAPSGRLARYAPELLVVALGIAYWMAPMSLQVPLVVGLKPRVLPLLWATCLLVARPAPLHATARCRRLIVDASVLVMASAACAVLVGWTLNVHGGKARDFAYVTTEIEPRSRILALIEQPVPRDDWPAGPWRHAAAWIVAERGGYASHAFFSTGSWLPLRRAHTDSGLRAPRMGQPRSFDFGTHAAGWDYILIRDLDVSARFDYVGDAASLVAMRGRWRLYRLGLIGP